MRLNNNLVLTVENLSGAFIFMVWGTWLSSAQCLHKLYVCLCSYTVYVSDVYTQPCEV